MGHLTLQFRLPTAVPQLSAVTRLLLGLKSSSKHRGGHDDDAQHHSRRVKETCTNVKETCTASPTSASVMRTMTPTPGMGTPLSRCSLAFTQGWLGAVQKENIYICVCATGSGPCSSPRCIRCDTYNTAAILVQFFLLLQFKLQASFYLNLCLSAVLLI